MNKKYKLKKVDDVNHKGGYYNIHPYIGLDGNLRVLNPIYPTVEQPINLYPKPLITGPKINIFQNKQSKYVKDVCSNKIYKKRDCLDDMMDMISDNDNTKVLNGILKTFNYKEIDSPLSDGLPPVSYFN